MIILFLLLTTQIGVNSTILKKVFKLNEIITFIDFLTNVF
jgi:hypothetical protein